MSSRTLNPDRFDPDFPHIDGVISTRVAFPQLRTGLVAQARPVFKHDSNTQTLARFISNWLCPLRLEEGEAMALSEHDHALLDPMQSSDLAPGSLIHVRRSAMLSL